MKPYTIIVRMKNSDVIIYDGWAKVVITGQARAVCEECRRVEREAAEQRAGKTGGGAA